MGVLTIAGWTIGQLIAVDRPPMRQRLFAVFGHSKLAGVRVTGDEDPAASAQRATVAERRKLSREIEAGAGKERTPQKLADRAVLLLALGRYDAAIRVLERASHQAPADLSVGGDLAAAYLARGLALERPRDLVRALERIGPTPRTLESAFNRSMALQSLLLRRLAKDSWVRYVERDTKSAWRSIAAAHLRGEGAVAEAHPGHRVGAGATTRVDSCGSGAESSRPEQIEAWTDEHGLQAWTSAVLAGDAAGRGAAERCLREAGERLVRISGDHLTLDEVAALAAAPTRALGALAEGLQVYAEAKDRLKRYAFEDGLALFRRAAGRFRLAGSPRLWWAEAGIAHCEFQLERYDIARHKAQLVLAVARRHGYVAVEGRCAWVLAAISLAVLDLESAERNAAACYEASQRAGSRIGVAKARLLLGRVEDELGDSTAAWSNRLRGFQGLAGEGDDETLALAIGNTAFALAREGEFHAAADFASEALAFDRRQGSSLGVVESLWTRAMYRARGEDSDGALADVREAETYLKNVDSAAIRSRLLAGLRAVEGGLLGERQPLVALGRLDEALSFLRRSGYEYGQVEILIDRARALRRLGLFEEALADLDHAKRIMTAQRGRIRKPVERVSFHDLQAELADERVVTSICANPPGERAFWAADQARGLLFRDRLKLTTARQDAGKHATARLASALSNTDALVSYWSLPDSLLIWVVRRDQPPRLVRQTVRREQLSDAIDDLVAAIGDRSEARVVSSLARHLGETLIGPVTSELSGVRRLIVVPDRVVRGVPWPALEVRPGGGPILRRFVIRMAPMAEALEGAAGSRERGGDGMSRGRLLAIGDPQVRAVEDALSARLPGARREIEGVTRLFDDHLTLVGGEATGARLIEEVGHASIVHIASHFDAGQGHGGTHIVLASATGQAAEYLDVTAIARLSLPRLRLVVLSGCATDREGQASLEGTFAAAGAFLAAGAGETIASLWPVDDSVSFELMVHFYRKLLEGRTADEALRSAQLALLDGADRTAGETVHWAAFQLVSLRL